MPRLSAALVVDCDPQGLEVLSYGLKAEGCRVTTASDYALVDLATSRRPQLAVVVAREPAEPALALARALRAPAEGAPVPVLMLGPPALRQEARAIAAVEFLPLPAFVRDVFTASKIVMAVEEASGGRLAPDADLSGALSEYGLFFLLRTMIGLGRSAILQVERANRRGEIRFVEGRVTAAQVGSLHGSAALHHLLLWEEAALDLKLRSVVHRGAFNQRPEDLLEEAERFLRDFAHASKNLGPVGVVFAVDEAKAAGAGQAIPAEVVPVVRLCDGQRTLGDVIEDSPFRVFDTIRIVSRMLDLGVLTTRRDGASRDPPARALDEWLTAAPAPVVTSTEERSGKPTGPLAFPARPVTEPRSGPARRRAGPRREHPTLEHGILSSRSPVPPGASDIPRAPDAAAAAPPVPAEPPVVAAAAVSRHVPPETTPAPSSAHGELRSRSSDGSGTGAADRRDPPSSHRRSPSVVVDFGVVGSDSAPATDVPARAAVVIAPPAAGPQAQVVGVVEGRPARGEGPVPGAPAGSTIQLDPELMAELVAIEMASTPVTPPPIASGPPPSRADDARRIYQVAVSNRRRAAPRPPATVERPVTPSPSVRSAPGVQMDDVTPAVAPRSAAATDVTPPLTLAAPVTSAAAPPPAAAEPSAGPPLAQEHPPAPAAAAPLPSADPPADPAVAAALVDPPSAVAPKRRPSSEFDALERDFFAREADLFGEETTAESPEESARKTAGRKTSPS
jgi:CheY-like chemotaxis protein